MAINEALHQELMAMFDRDQKMRIAIQEKYQSGEAISPEDSDWWVSVDTEHTQRMREIIAEFGWPGTSLVGEQGAMAAWLLVQHADRQPEFQAQCLELLRAAVEAGEGSATNLAYLIDRVRVNSGQPQVYGTQCHTVNGELVSREIEDADHVDERRASVGLKPVAEYLASMRG